MTRDVVVVGAGPAGSALAAQLVDYGRSVLLLDRATFPRQKLCGEFLGPGCRAMLDDLGVLREVERAARPVRGMRVFARSGATLAARYPGGQAGFALRRSELDHLLLKTAVGRGVESFEGFRVEKLIVEDGVVRGVAGRSRNGPLGEFRARVTVGADGRNSIVARRLGLFRWQSRHRRTALCVRYDDAEDAGDCAEVFLGSDCYGVLNPLRDGTANLSIVVAQDDFTLRKGRVEDCFGEGLRRLPRLAERLGSATAAERVQVLGPLAHSASRLSWHGALLAGDAAGFYDPFTGEGIYMALRGARLAARVIQEALACGDVSARFLGRYDDEHRREFAPRYRLEALVQQIILRPRLADFVVARLGRAAGAAESLMGVLGGLLPPRELHTARFAGGFLLGGRLPWPRSEGRCGLH